MKNSYQKGQLFTCMVRHREVRGRGYLRFVDYSPALKTAASLDPKQRI